MHAVIRLHGYYFEFNWKQGISASKLVYEHFKGKTVSENEVSNYVIMETPYRYRKEILKYLEKEWDPPKITEVENRTRKFSFPEGCIISFSS